MNTPTMLEPNDRPALPPPEHEQKLLPPAPPVRRRSFWWLWLLIGAGLCYGGYRYYQANQQKDQKAAQQQAARAAGRPVPVVGATARKGDIPVYLRGLGTVAAFNTVAVKSRVDGQLISINFKEGQFVHQGEVLAQLDPRPFQVQLDQAQGQLARDQAQLKDAQVNLARYQALWDEQVIAKQQLDTQGATVGQVKGTITADQAAINNANLQLSYARITAPISGRIGLRLVDVGNMVHAADPNGLIVITQLQPIAVLFTIPADNLPPVLRKLRAGDHPVVDAYDRDDTTKLASGTLLTVDNQIDPTTGTAKMKAVFNNTDNALFPNQFVNGRLLLDVVHGATIIPVPAVQHGPQGNFVYVVNPDKTASIRPITLGLTEGNDSGVQSGLQPGEIVVTDGQDKLQPGSKVDVRAPGRAPAAGARGSSGSRLPQTAPGSPTNGHPAQGMTPASRSGAVQGMPPGQIPTQTTPLNARPGGARKRP